jgi:hypothetical protein
LWQAWERPESGGSAGRCDPFGGLQRMFFEKLLDNGEIRAGGFADCPVMP